MKTKLIVISSLAILILILAGVSWAAFGDRSKILGSSFSVGSVT